MKQSFLFFPSIQKYLNIIFLVKKSSAEQKQTNKQTDKQELPESSLKTFLKIKGGGEKKKKKKQNSYKKKKKKKNLEALEHKNRKQLDMVHLSGYMFDTGLLLWIVNNININNNNIIINKI